MCQLGTLGGGNHFIELCIDEEQYLWVMLHSGSRGTGNAMGRYFIEAVKKDMRRHKMNAVMANQADLAEVVHTLKQVVCVKG
ncbi:MAG: RtcB family protein [Burkholderiales bacterium]